MALSAYFVYQLTTEYLRKYCIERGIDSDGPASSLRRRLAEDIKGGKMEQTEQMGAMQASVQTDLLRTSTGNMSLTPSEDSQRGSGISRAPMLVELLRKSRHCHQRSPKEYCD